MGKLLLVKTVRHLSVNCQYMKYSLEYFPQTSLVEIVLIRREPMFRSEIPSTDVVVSYEYPLIIVEHALLSVPGRTEQARRERQRKGKTREE